MISTRRSRRRGSRAPRLAALGGAAAFAAVVAAALRLLRPAPAAGSGASTSPGWSARSRVRATVRRVTGARGSTEHTWQCACGQRFRVAGVERHRVFWVEGAPESDPVMSDRCPSCERPLPASAATAVA
jgi:hypothetical protein